MIPPPLQASKWLSIQALVSEDEMESLLTGLGEFSIMMTSPSDSPEIGHDEFLAGYRRYCQTIRNGDLPEPSAFRALFSTFWTKDETAYVKVPVSGKLLCRAVKPVVQLQYHLMGYSKEEKKFRPMVMGKGSIPWGIQFSYPTLFQDQKAQKVLKVGDDFPNTALFQEFRRWIRKETIPTPFLVEGKQINIPMRIGNQARNWINHHPQLCEYALKVQEAS